MSTAVLTTAKQSTTLRRLLGNLDGIIARVDDPTAWVGMRVGGMYDRLECRDHLVTPSPNRREYSVGIHLFDHPVPGELHDHRWPFAVYPFGERIPDGTALYEMPWEHGSRRGNMTVRSRQPYAIEQCNVRHAVCGIRPHLSIVLADVTAVPTRSARLAVTPLSTAAIVQIMIRFKQAVI